MPCGHLLVKVSFVMSNCEVVTFPLVFLVRCGTCLYRFLIFDLFPFLTLMMNTFTEALYFLHVEVMAILDHYNSLKLET